MSADSNPSPPEPQPSPGNGASGSDSYDPSQRNGSTGEALHEAMRQLHEWQDYFRYYLATWIDGFKGSIRRAVIYTALGLLALFVAATIVITAAVLLLSGVSGAISRLFHSEPWVGNLMVGSVILIGLAGGAWFGLSSLERAWKSKSQARYESFKRQQRLRWGHDVDDVAAKPERSKP
jgi:hypothetical protein